MDSIKLTGNSQLLKKTKSKLNPRELSLALAEQTECGYGINPLKGYIVLPDFNSTTGNIDGRVALYVLDGILTVGPVDEVKELIEGYCLGIVPSIG